MISRVSSSNTRRAYTQALNRFYGWHRPDDRAVLNRTVVEEYRKELEQLALAPSTVNIHLAAIRRLAVVAAENGLISFATAAEIGQVPGARLSGNCQGTWLNRKQAEVLLHLPDTARAKGRRDQVLLALLLGCGLRRGELAELCVDQVQKLQGRWVIVKPVNAQKRERSIPMPVWVKTAIDRWLVRVGINEGKMLRPINKSDRIAGDRMTPQSVYDVVERYSRKLGIAVAPRDLRRTFARLALDGRAPLEQIRLSLGNSSPQTTERYLGIKQNLRDAPCDHLGLQI
jgi:site-specific recombinase XerD